MVTIETIGVVSLARTLGALMGLVGLGTGILYSFGGAVIDVLVSYELITTSETPGVSWGTVLAVGALPATPIISGTVGVISGAVVAVLYNSVSKRIGGVEIRLEG
jgi:hypothetical protein